MSIQVDYRLINKKKNERNCNSLVLVCNSLLLVGVVCFSECVCVCIRPRNLRPLSSCLRARHDNHRHPKVDRSENNGFRFCCQIRSGSDSISHVRRLFNHPMYAPLPSILLKILFFFSLYLNFVEREREREEKDVQWFDACLICLVVADRALLKITEEEFSGPPLNVSGFFLPFGWFDFIWVDV